MSGNTAVKGLRWGLALVLVALAPLALGGCEGIIAPVEEPQPPELVISEEDLPVFLQVASCSATDGYVRALVEGFRSSRPRVVFEVTMTSPRVGVDMVAAGEAQLAVVTTARGQKVQSEPREGSLPLEATPLASDGLALVVHASREVASLTQADVVALFTGYVLDWGELGAGHGLPEVVVQDASSTSRGLFDTVLLDGRAVSSAAVIVPDDGAVVAYVATHPGAVGYAAGSVIGEGVRAVPVDVGLSSRAGSGRTLYPASQEVTLVTPLTMTAEVQALAAYVDSARGQELLAKHFSGR